MLRSHPFSKPSSTLCGRTEDVSTIFRRRLILLALAGAAGLALSAQPAVAVPLSFRAAAGASVPDLAAAVGLRTCTESLVATTATVAAECGAWLAAAPLNVIVVAPRGANVGSELLSETDPAWQPARGGWLVEEAGVTASTSVPCDAGWYASGAQLELRLSGHSRRHLKLIPLSCHLPGGDQLVVASAHTDVWTQACGDHVVDVDRARDALVGALLAGDPEARVQYRQEYRAGTLYGGGCHGRFVSDGRVAVIFLRPESL